MSGRHLRFRPHDPEILHQIYRFYLRCHGAECSSQQFSLRQMAQAAHRIAWLLRVEKGIFDLLAADAPTQDHEILWQHLDELARDRALWLHIFDRAFECFCRIRAARNDAELHLALTGSERYPVPEQILFPDPAFSILPLKGELCLRT